MNSLASMQREGKGRPKDLPAAIEWYKKAAALNNLDAINNLGQMHEAGEGVTKNLEVAIEFYQQAANGGHLDAQTNLGYIYEHGSEDDVRYMHTCLHCTWPVRAAGYSCHILLACMSVLLCLQNNYVPIDLDAASAWYTEASEKGYAKAQNNLGYLYFIGAVGGTPDYAQAIKWFTKYALHSSSHRMAACGSSAGTHMLLSMLCCAVLIGLLIRAMPVPRIISVSALRVAKVWHVMKNRLCITINRLLSRIIQVH